MVSKSCVVLCCLIVAVIAEEKYSSKYDNFNVDEVLENERLLSSYENCILDKGACTPEGKALREHLQDGMQTGCSKCTKAQKIKARKVANYLRNHEQQFWEDVKKKFDPENKFKATYEAFLASED